MYEPPHPESPPAYSPPAYSQSVYEPPCSPAHQHTSHHYVPCSSGSAPVAVELQHFYPCLSPPGLVKAFQGATALACLVIVALVASTLGWDVGASAYGGSGSVSSSGHVETIFGSYSAGSYSYSYSSSYMTPASAKAAMMAVSGVNFVLSLLLLVGSCSRARVSRGCKFYLTVFVCDVVLAILQGIVDIIFAIGVNPAAQSSQTVLYNPLLMICKTSQGVPSLSASLGAGYPAGFPLYNQHLHHYCYMDPQEVAALVLGLLVVPALSVSAFYACKTRSKIWRHGKASILWDKPCTGRLEGLQVQDWTQHYEEPPPRFQDAAARPSAPPLPVENSAVSYVNGAVSLPSEGHVGSHSLYPNLHMGPRTEF